LCDTVHVQYQFFQSQTSEGLSEIVGTTDHHSFWKCNTAIYFSSFPYQKAHLCTLNWQLAIFYSNTCSSHFPMSETKTY